LTLQDTEEIGNSHPMDAVSTEVIGAVPGAVTIVDEVAMAGE
jgi:hypothetical protein